MKRFWRMLMLASLFSGRAYQRTLRHVTFPFLGCGARGGGVLQHGHRTGIDR